ncbi:WD40 repeat-like protein [Hanseniaspora valbyensis NRRL Y-1626]|uniref:WD40 repeat-like protein n=1 Tax=Hanseniaspora valbyensis NRRL Y-1626 TaxID=766949 RepID=A0A1B7T836_9ASCO|nr:WD40 repeat-like protein [Hanseniaspora valbyensis NRRL Y-1626]
MSSTQGKVAPFKQPLYQSQQVTSEQRFWKTFTNLQIVKEYQSIQDIQFNPVSPNDFIVLSSSKVQCFSSKTRQVIKQFTRFKEQVLSADFRYDGKLMSVSDKSGMISIYDSYQPKNLILQIRPKQGEEFPVHKVKFNNVNRDPSKIYIAGDDRLVKVYDLSNSYSPLNVISGSDDYVRSLDFLPDNPNVLITGSYDKRVRLYDLRNNTGKPILKFDQGAPVEDIVAINDQNIVTCGGNGFKCWDIAKNGRELNESNNFNKTVTSLNYISKGEQQIDIGNKDTSIANCLIASSLDGHVKVFDPLDNFKLKFGWKFSGPVLKTAISPTALTNQSSNNDSNNKHLVVGLSTGLLAIRTRKKGVQGRLNMNNLKGSAKFDAVNGNVKSKSSSFNRMMAGRDFQGLKSEQIIYDDKLTSSNNATGKQRQFEKNIQQFKWFDALISSILTSNGNMMMPLEVTLSCINDLKRKDKLKVALQGKSFEELKPLVDWILKYGIGDVRSCGLALEVLGILLDSCDIEENYLKVLLEKLENELKKSENSKRVQGILEMLI